MISSLSRLKSRGEERHGIAQALADHIVVGRAAHGEADGTVHPPANYAPLPAADRMSIIPSMDGGRALPPWLYASERGDGIYPPQDWGELEKLMVAFGKANPDLPWFTPFNEPDAHWRGNDEEFVRRPGLGQKGVQAGSKVPRFVMSADECRSRPLWRESVTRRSLPRFKHAVVVARSRTSR